VTVFVAPVICLCTLSHLNVCEMLRFYDNWCAVWVSFPLQWAFLNALISELFCFQVSPKYTAEMSFCFKLKNATLKLWLGVNCLLKPLARHPYPLRHQNMNTSLREWSKTIVITVFERFLQFCSFSVKFLKVFRKVPRLSILGI